MLQDVSKVGVVLIGRNEGERLRRALESLVRRSERLVYVDSGSKDDSVALARSFGAAVVELDMGKPFTAARARNAGFEELIRQDASLSRVFFVDGDCEVAPDWLATASAFLGAHPDVALVWGLRRERFPEVSIYNALLNVEWQEAEPGATKYCGGDAVIRVDAFRQVGGYRPDLICGEEPEMCVRLRRAGWRIWHLKESMTIHDAAIHRFAQWWKRMVRSGYAFANGAALHGGQPEFLWVRESWRIWMWTLAIPLACLGLTALVGPWALLCLLLYPAQVIRVATRSNLPAPLNWWRAGSLQLGKFAELLGQLKFILDRVRQTRSGLIEYK